LCHQVGFCAKSDEIMQGHQKETPSEATSTRCYRPRPVRPAVGAPAGGGRLRPRQQQLQLRPGAELPLAAPSGLAGNQHRHHVVETQAVLLHPLRERGHGRTRTRTRPDRPLCGQMRGKSGARQHFRFCPQGSLKASESESEPFIANYVFTCKAFVMVGDATLDRNIKLSTTINTVQELKQYEKCKQLYNPMTQLNKRKLPARLSPVVRVAVAPKPAVKDTCQGH